MSAHPVATTPVSAWRPAREVPATYPGDAPDGSYCIVGDEVVALRWSGGAAGAGAEVRVGGDWVALADVLARWSMPPWEERVPLVAYGANRNPATIVLKQRHHGGAGGGGPRVVPMLQARARGVDVVAGGLSSQGYLYGDLHLDAGPVEETDVDVWVLLADDELLRVMHDSEGVRGGAYAVARLGNVGVDGHPGDLEALAYVARRPAFRSPELGQPVAFSAVAARGRRLPAMDAPTMLEHALRVLDLDERVRALTGITDAALAPALMAYLNGQFWYRQHTGLPGLEGRARVEALLRDAIATCAQPTSSAARLEAQGRVLDEDEAYAVAPELRLGRWWA